MEVRYALMVASIASYTANISTDLLRATGPYRYVVVRNEDLTMPVVSRIPRDNLDALLVIRDEVNAEEHPAMLAQALTLQPRYP